MQENEPFCTPVYFCLFVDAGIEFHFNLCDEVDHMIVAEYHKPLVFGEIRNTTVAEQLTYRDAVSLSFLLEHIHPK